MDKYLVLAKKLKKQIRMRVMVIPVVVGAPRTVLKVMEKTRGRIETM